MERKGGCCLAPRYAAAGTGQSWQMGRIMLKFRPIAPKPAAMAPVPSPSPAPVAAAAAGRGKRKAAAGGGGRRGRKPKKAATVALAPAPAVPAPAAVKTMAGQKKESDKDKSLSERSSSSSGIMSVESSPPPSTPPAPTTLPLMPVLPAEEKPASAASTAAAAPAAPSHAVGGEHVVAPRPVRPAATSWVMVEDVTATWRDGEAPSTATTPWAGDDEAPAFVSDQWGRVTWTNPAFSGAVSADVEVRVGLPANLGVAAIPAWGTCAGFTCRVRVHSDGSPRRGGSGPVVAPCDVWRLDAGGCYLWRLDLQAALTLGGGLP